jgi:hypothetical protein
MKNKIYLIFALFIAFNFFVIFDIAFAQTTTCVGQGGVCADSTNCANAFHKITGSGCPNPTSDICCKADSIAAACTENGGSCKDGSSCGSGFVSAIGTGCRTSQVCCKQDVSASSAASTKNAVVFANPLRFSTVEGLLAAVLNTFRGVVVVLSMIFFIYGAIVYITSAGSDDRIKSGKNAMSASLIGLALGIAAPSILKTIAEVLDWKGTSAELATAPSATAIGLKILSFLLGIVGILGMIMLVSGGIMYFAAGANEKSVETAKGIVKYAVIGIALALGAMVIIRQISALLT